MKTFRRLLVLLLAAAAARAGPAPLEVMPAPAAAVRLEGRLVVSSAFRVGGVNNLNPGLVEASNRLVAAWNSRTGLTIKPAPSASPTSSDGSGSGTPHALRGPNLLIDCATSPGPALPQLGDDESYRLDISPRQAVLRAQTASGVRHGLATLQQLLAQDAAGWYLPAVSIQDRPRFPWRGLLVDVARRWKPVEDIKRTLDGMALVKLNVLHFHLTDDQGFRVESKTHPELTEKGSDGRYYRQADLRAIVAYAAARGIRVVPEFDLPGHATSWLVSHPELASAPGPFLIERHWGVFDPVMDPTNEGVYSLLQDVFAELAALFPDPYFHLGGDENNGVEWSANPAIQAFIRGHRLVDNAGLHAYFNRRVGAILAGLGKRLIGWDEILHPDLPRGDVIESWRGPDSLAAASRLGFQGILAHGYYLDICHPAADYYQADPLPEGSPLTADERKRVLGGEASMWGEWVSTETIDSRVWPRAAAVAERLWSPASVRDPAEMYRRLEIVDQRLAEAGMRQHSYVAPAINRLLGGTPIAADAALLAQFVEMIEPVQNYARGKAQPGSDQLTPLVGIADVARPDSALARHFAQTVREYVGGPSLHAHDLEDLRAFFLTCRFTGRQLAGPLASHCPGIAPAGPLGFQLEDAGKVGFDALSEFSLRGKPDRGDRPPYDRDLALLRLTADAEPHDGALLAIITPIRELVRAAAAP